MVVAETAAAARDAAELIAVDYEPLPAVVDTAHALDPGQPQVWDEAPGNLCFDWEIGDRAAVERAMAGARHRIVARARQQPDRRQFDGAARRARRIRSGRGDLHPVELDPGLAFPAQSARRNVFKVPENRIRVVTRDVGGGFGMKLFLYPEHVLVLWAAKKTRPAGQMGARTAPMPS